MDADSYLFICKQVGLSIEELQYMTIGGVIDYAHTYADEMNPKKTKKKKASQQDFDSF